MSAPAGLRGRRAVRFLLRTDVFDRLLKERGFLADDVAGAVQVDKSTVSRWRTRAISVRGDYALTVCALLGCGFSDLFEREGP